mgnify:CR=1 FL=1
MVSLRKIFEANRIITHNFYHYNPTTQGHTLMWFEATPMKENLEAFSVNRVTKSWDLFTGKKRVFWESEPMVNFARKDLHNEFTYEEAIEKLKRLERLTHWEKKFKRQKVRTFFRLKTRRFPE